MTHCVTSVQIRSFFWSVLSRIRTEYGEILRTVFSPNAEKYGPEKTPYLDTFHAVLILKVVSLEFLCRLRIPGRANISSTGNLLVTCIIDNCTEEDIHLTFTKKL